MPAPKLVPPHATEDAPSSAPASDRGRKSPAICAAEQEEHRESVRLISFALAATGTTQDRAARILGVSLRNLQLKLDPEGPRRISDVAIRRLCKAVDGFAHVYGTSLATLGPAPRQAVARPPVEHVVQLSVELGDVARSFAEASADGAISREDRRALAREVHDVIEQARRFERDLGDPS